MRLFLLSFLVVALTFTDAAAQKFGHLNIGNLIEVMPEAKVADSLLIQLRDQFLADGTARAAAFKSSYETFMAAYQGGTMTPAVAQAEQEKLQAEYEAIERYSATIEDSVSTRRNELLAPIMKKIDTAVQEIGKENGYTAIFDASVMNVILFVRETDDVEAMVRKKLGLP